jgi:PmbA protein
MLTRGTDMLFVGDEMSSCQAIADVSPVVNNVIRQLERAEATVAVRSSRMPVIFTPHGVAGALLAPLVSGFNGKLVYEKASPLAGKAGQKLMDAKLSLYDDATLPLRPTSRPFDDEGVPSRCCPLVEEGVVNYFYYDLRTAALAKTKSTGHGHRTPGQPAPSPSAFIFPEGETSFEEMVSGIEQGLVVEQLMGATQGNILGGDFSGNVLLGYKVEHGKITGRVKDTVVFGNVYSLLEDITALGGDGRWVGGTFTPSILFPSLSVAAKT